MFKHLTICLLRLCLLFTFASHAADNILTKEEKAAGWILLFNGKDLQNWKQDYWHKGGFTVENNSIRCNGKASMLYYNGPFHNFRDFHFSADVLTQVNANSGIFFHTKHRRRGWPVGHEAQVNNSHKDKVKTGSIYKVREVLEKHHQDNEWFKYEIIVKGKKITIKINGETVSEYLEESHDGRRKLASGTFALQAHDPESIVYFKNIKTRIFQDFSTKSSKGLSRSERVEQRQGEWYERMDFGPAIASTVGTNQGMILKGQTVRVGHEQYSMVYDTEMMSFNTAFKGFLNISGTAWDNQHSGSPSTSPFSMIDSGIGPGWAYKGSFEDSRQSKYGPLPKNWLKYKGQYRHGDEVVLSYTVGESHVLEYPAFEQHQGATAFTRTLNISQTSESLTLRVLKNVPDAGLLGDNKRITVAAIGEGVQLRQSGSDILADISGNNLKVKIILAFDAPDLKEKLSSWPVAKDLNTFTQGGPEQWPQTIPVKGIIGRSKGPYVAEEIPLPEENPWQSNIRFSGFDFFSDGKRAAICTWNGDVWVVSGIDDKLQNLRWKRYAAGLFETLGLKIVDDVIYVTGKDQITRLHDLNNDGEADFYENFNNDIKITRNFHEFTFDLQTDPQGNFYFAKGAPVLSGGRGFDETHEHHGIVFKVSKDGSHSEVWATGMRAPGGMGVGPNGEVTTGENEGTWVPACKINWAAKGTFSGVIHPGNGRKMEQGYDNPLCWLPMTVDNSGGGQVWVDNKSWGPFEGDMLHLSYGRSKIYKVMKQEVDGVVQGGVFELPIKLSSAAMRGRFNPVDKQLYVAGFRGWQTNAAKPSALQRIRFTGKTVATPQNMRVTKKGVYLTFTQELDKELAEDISSYSVKWWNYLWSPQYGSAHYSVNNVDEKAIQEGLQKETKALGTKGDKVAAASFKGDSVPVSSAKLLEDGKTVFLAIPGIRPVMQMEISLDLETVNGDLIITKIYNSIYKLAEK